MEGFIQLHRKMLDWEWYDDINTKVLFIHLLLKANWKEKSWRGEIIKRGTLITGRIKLSEETGLTEQQIRTSLNKLKSTNEITIKTTNKNSIITILKYDEYQRNNQQDNTQITNNQPTINQQITTTNKDNNNNKENKEIIVSKDTTAIAEKKQITQDIDFLINEIKEVCISYGLAYDKTQERNFARHILTAKEYGDFAEKVGIDRVRLAKNIVALSQKWWKSISGPKDIYQNYAKCYNDCKTKSESSKIVKIETLDW